MSTIVVKTLEALSIAGAVSKETAMVAAKLGVDHPKASKERLTQVLAGVHSGRPDVLGRVAITPEQRKELGVDAQYRYAYYLRKPLEKIRFTEEGNLERKAKRGKVKHRRRAPAPRITPARPAITADAERIAAGEYVLEMLGPGLVLKRTLTPETANAILKLIIEKGEE